MTPTTRSKTKEGAANTKEVKLPMEMVCYILGYATYEDLLKYRLIKKSWNEAATRVIRSHVKLPIIHIQKYQAIQNLIMLRTNAIQPNFLTKFDIVLSELNISAIIQFGLEFGSFLRVLTIDTRKKTSSVKRMRAKVQELLGHCPILDTLTIIGNNDGTSFIEDLEEGTDLSRVRTLTLKSPYDPVLSVISHSVVYRWVTKMRSLCNLTVSCTLDPEENSQLESFLTSIGPMKHLSLCLRFKAENRDIFRSLAVAKVKLHDLNLVVDMDEDDDRNLLFLNLYTWLAWQGQHLTRLTHQLHTQITDGPILDKLKQFRQPLRTSGRSAQPFRVGQASSLYFVSILSNDHNEPVDDSPAVEPHLGILANMEQSIISINTKTSKILKYLFPNMKIVHSSHYFVA